MRILLTGANGYIGRRLLPVLIEQGHEVVAVVRSKLRLEADCEVVEADLLKPETFGALPKDIDAAYYLVHSMSHCAGKFDELEAQAAHNFVRWIETTSAKQTLYLGALSQTHSRSRHLASRLKVEEILKGSKVDCTTLRAGIIVGSGSASFEIMRGLVEKLPVMVAPRWVSSKCQPIAIYDVLTYLTGVLGLEGDHTFEIGGPDILSYKEMLLCFAKVRGLKRYVLTVPVLTPRLSSYWLFFVTNTNFALARSLVRSLKSDAICTESSIQEIVPHTCYTFEEAVEKAFHRIAETAVLSSWKDAWISGRLAPDTNKYIEVPTRGCLSDYREIKSELSKADLIQNVWSLGGENGWLFMNSAWRVRGVFDRMLGGVGLRRGRPKREDLRPGDALDFWRVILADRDEGRLLLYAEMKLPGEAWLEFHCLDGKLTQQATFRPRGLWGRLYWYGIYPLHVFVFRGMAKALAGVLY